MTAGQPSRTIERRKPYKACEPLDTIEHVRGILQALDLFTIELHLSYDGPSVYCCRVYLGDEELASLNIGTNGKSLTRRYALASAYGEFMERLQNGTLISLRHVRLATKRHLEASLPPAGFARRLDEAGLRLDFHRAPDEVYVAQDQLLEDCSDLLRHLLGAAGREELSERLRRFFDDRPVNGLPYYSVGADRVRLVPADLVWPVCGTNGMCAGNTPAEALVEGISELCERFAYRTLFLHDITPPEVPLELFAGTEVYEHVRQLVQTTGFGARVLDCSLGIGLPVLGLMLTAPDGRHYALHLGADPCPSTALMRCLTELFQGERDMVLRRFREVPVEGAEWGEARRQRDFWRALFDSYAEWPPAVLRGAPTYAFEGFPHPVSVSDEDDVVYMTKLILDSGRDLLVRDVSYLGFPAYQVYIPGMSEIDYLFEGRDIGIRADLEKTTHALFDLRCGDPASLQALALALERALGSELPDSLVDLRRWLISNTDVELSRLTVEELLVLLWTRVGEYARAADAAERLLRSGDDSAPVLYWRAVRDYCAARGAGQDGTAAVRLCADHGETLAARVLERFAEPQQVFEHGRWPSCFDCDACPVASTCIYFDVLRRARVLQDRYLANTPDQLELRRVFGAPR